ncbi:MAG TPA: hypothetical protein VGJ87_23470, partial [Roseiflexaceae bacterium]
MATEQPLAWRSSSGATTGPLLRLWDRRLLLLVALALLAGFLAYQAPAATDIAVGWLGDRLFLRASEGAGAAAEGSFYGDELSADAAGIPIRSRWTRQAATMWLPGFGAGGDLQLTLRAQGWPNDALHPDVRQPTVIVAANGAPIGQFGPSVDWADYPLTIPAGARSAEPLVLTLHASDTFTHTATYLDTRPKGVRLAGISVHEPGASFTWPAPVPLLWLALDS